MSKVVGIDLGTTFSAIAELDDLGNPEVLSDPESGNRITRSAVYFGKDKVIVGEKARDASVTSPKKVVFEVKREMENAIDEDYNFSVPLIVDANSAKNWNDAH